MNKLKTHNELLGQYVRIKYPEIEEEFEEIYESIAERLVEITKEVSKDIVNRWKWRNHGDQVEK